MLPFQSGFSRFRRLALGVITACLLMGTSLSASADIPGLIIQTGGFDADLTRIKSGDPVVNESRPTARNLRGTLASAQ